MRPSRSKVLAVFTGFPDVNIVKTDGAKLWCAWWALKQNHVS